MLGSPPVQRWLPSLQEAGCDGNRALGTKSALSYPEKSVLMAPESNLSHIWLLLAV